METHYEKLNEFLETGFHRKKSSGIILVAEGKESGGAFEIAKKVEKDFKEYDVKVTVLGHIQRGGSPSAFDRVSASRLGVAAIDALLDDQQSIMVGMSNGEIAHVPFNKTIKRNKPINQEMLDIADILTI